jgi:hypothetical protein
MTTQASLRATEGRTKALLKELDDVGSVSADLSPGDPLCLEAAACIRKLEIALRDATSNLRRGAYDIGNLGLTWTVTTVTSECQKIQRKLQAAAADAMRGLDGHS